MPSLGAWYYVMGIVALAYNILGVFYTHIALGLYIGQTPALSLFADLCMWLSATHYFFKEHKEEKILRQTTGIRY